MDDMKETAWCRGQIVQGLGNNCKKLSTDTKLKLDKLYENSSRDLPSNLTPTCQLLNVSCLVCLKGSRCDFLNFFAVINTVNLLTTQCIIFAVIIKFLRLLLCNLQHSGILHF